jgi:hypothetical protein
MSPQKFPWWIAVKNIGELVLCFHRDPVAQLVEHLTFNQRVVGSNPARVTKESVSGPDTWVTLFSPRATRHGAVIVSTAKGTVNRTESDSKRIVESCIIVYLALSPENCSETSTRLPWFHSIDLGNGVTTEARRLQRSSMRKRM